MLLPFLLCVLILYIPLPLSDGAVPLSVGAGGVALLALFNAAAAYAGSGLAMTLSRLPGARGALAANRVFLFLKGGVVGLVLADVLVLKWPALVDDLLGAHPWALMLEDLLLLAPAIVMIVTLMAFQYRFDYNRGRVHLSLSQCLWLRLRVELGIILVPWLILVLVTDTVNAAFYGTRWADTADSVSSGLILLAIIVFSPLLLRFIWSTSSLPAGPLRERLEALCRRQKLRCNDILLWHTHNHLANAGVAGPTPLVRYVLLTDALVQRSTPDEVEAIFAHEVGHVRHHHLGFYMLFAVAFVCFYVNLVDLVALTGWVTPVRDILAFHMTAEQGAVMLGFAAIYWVLIFGFVSRRMEQQADLFSIEAVEEPRSFLSALRRLAALSGAQSGFASWRHFSIPRRIAFLLGVLADPPRAKRLRAAIAAMQIALVGLLVLGAARLLVFRPHLFGL